MHLSNLWLLAFGAAANAFTDTSPFFVASTSELLSSSAEIKTAASLSKDISSVLSTCPSDYYVVAFQPGVHSTDYATRKSAPRLGAKVLGQDKAIRSSMAVGEVAGVLEAGQVRGLIEEKCGVGRTVVDVSSGTYPSTFDKAPRVIAVDFPMLSLGSDRAQRLSDNDGILADIIDKLPSSSYTLIYVTSPKESPNSESAVYDPDSNEMYQDPLHMQLKRDYSAHMPKETRLYRKASVFQEYQYFTPGLFMGFLASFICLGILYVGFTALASLEVPYAAFEKDVAAGAQKKQQ